MSHRPPSRRGAASGLRKSGLRARIPTSPRAAPETMDATFTREVADSAHFPESVSLERFGVRQRFTRAAILARWERLFGRVCRMLWSRWRCGRIGLCGCAQPFSAFLGAPTCFGGADAFPVAGPVEPLLFGSLTRWAALVFPCPVAARLFHVEQPPVARVCTDSGVDAPMGDVHSAHLTPPLRGRLPTRLARVGRSCVLHRRRGVTSVVFGLDRNGAVVVARRCRPHPSPTLRLRCPPTRQLVITTRGAHFRPSIAMGDIHSAHRTEPRRERLPTRPAQTRLGGCSRCCVRTHPISPPRSAFRTRCTSTPRGLGGRLTLVSSPLGWPHCTAHATPGGTRRHRPAVNQVAGRVRCCGPAPGQW